MAKKRRNYTRDFKLDALRHWQSSAKSATEVEDELDISHGLLYKWRQQLGDEALLEQGEGGAQPDESTTELEATAAAAEAAMAEETPSEPAVETKEAGDEIAVEFAAQELAQEVNELKEEKQQSELEAVDSELEQKEIAADRLDEESAEKAVEAAPNRVKIIARRIGGIVGMVLGAVGIILSVIAVVAVWVVNTPVTEGTQEILATIDTALDVVDEGLVQADSALVTVRERVQAFATNVEEANLGEDLIATINSVRSVVDSAQSAADTAGSVVGFANSIPFLQSDSSADGSSAQTLEQASSTLAEISGELDAAEQRLTSLRERGAAVELVNQFDQDLAQLQARIQTADMTIREVDAAVEQLHQDIPGWIDLASILFTLLYLWFGLAQYSLFAGGWTWFRS